MASSDDETEAVPESVSNYHFVDNKDEPISFSVLPVKWSESESFNGDKKHIFLHGTADHGLQKLYKHIIAWKFELSNVNPEISVLTKENCWIKLQKPRKSFEDIIRTVCITVHCLHIVKRSPEILGKSLWDQLSKVFSLYEIRPSQNDLVDHAPLISEAVKRDDTLAKSKFLLAFLEEKPSKRKLSDEDVQAIAKSGFIVDDMDDVIDDAEEDESNEDEDLFDTVCSFCDNGGDLLCCEGRCMRSFHATEEAGEESDCTTLKLSEKEVKAIQNFFCKNCESKQHQCFACGNLGSSDKSSGAEVFPCVSATCGRFYHPRCVAKLLYRDNEVEAEEHEKKIAAGQSFTCPIHKCYVCKQGENKKVFELQFAVCRRCPKAYHRKCLPRKIAFEDIEDEGIVTRAWDGLLPNRVLIYCLKHEIKDDLGTPERDHIKFPYKDRKKTTVEEKKKKKASELPTTKVLSKKRSLAPEDSFQDRYASKAPRLLTSALKGGESTIKSGKVSSGPDSLRKVKVADVCRKSSKDIPCPDDENKSSLGNKLYALVSKLSEQAKLGKQDTPYSVTNKNVTVGLSTKKLSTELPALDADTERRLLTLMKDAASSITLDDIVEQHKVPSTHAYSSKTVVDKTITVGKLEGSVEAVRTALQKLEEGASIDDAKAVCEPEVLNQIFRWKNKVKVYLAPFLYGMRYTSFGRHFTKPEKLEEIVDKLHWYVQNSDMIVDFCCGANDFSQLMKKKLEETGKSCSYKNYDWFQAKNDFCFEKRDWMTVSPKELPTGSQLIMGLNPPFGVRAALANKFIDKALEFNPKLLILIVPPETERLEKKKSPYDLVWEDDQFLSGKSFYLPGSIDVNDKQMDQWNVKPPVLYLWSRRDWSDKHKAIAQKQSHIPRQQEGSILERDCHETQIPDHPVEDHGHYGANSTLTDGLPMQFSELEERGGGKGDTDGHKENSPCNIADRESQDDHGHQKNQSNETSRKKRRGKNNLRGGTCEKLAEDKQNVGRPPVQEMPNEMSHHSSPSVINGRSSLEGPSSRSFEMPSNTPVVEDGYQHFETGMSGSRVQYGTAYGGTGANIPDDMGRRYGLNSDEPYSRFLGGANLEEHFTGRMRDGADSLGYRPYMERESDIRAQVRLYGQFPDLSSQRNYLVGRDPGYGQMGFMSPSSYGNLGSVAESSHRISISATQRYVPRLDELNHPRISPLGSEPPMVSRNGIFDPRPRVPHPGPGSRDDSMGFAPGPFNPYSHQNSAGWLNE